MQDINKFIAEHSGERINFDGVAYKGQCTQLVKQFAKESGWQIPNSGGTNRAIDYKNFTNGYKFIKNTPSGVPVPGDFAIFSVGYYGHIALVIGGSNSRALHTFEENDLIGSGAHVKTYDYVRPSCIGWLHKV